MKRFRIAVALAIGLLSSGCPKLTPVGEWGDELYECLNQGQTPESAIAQLKASLANSVAKSRDGLYGMTDLFWRPENHVIAICWDDVAATPEMQASQKRIRETIEATWGKALALQEVPEKERYRFGGWGTCGSEDSSSIHISVVSTMPEGAAGFTTGVGTELAGKSAGVNLLGIEASCRESARVTASTSGLGAFGGIPVNVSPSAAEQANFERCVNNKVADGNHVVIHEFGHALGFEHEQKRPDTPLFCRNSKIVKEYADQSEIGGGNLTVGSWDGESVMNYCGPRHNYLSKWDEVGIQVAYYPQYFNLSCLVKKRDEALAKELKQSRSPANSSRSDKGDLPGESSVGTRPTSDAGVAP